MIDEILKHNEDFVNNGSYLHYSAGKYPRKKLAVLSCMDTRLVELLPAALGIKDGDVKMIKNAGAVITDPFDTTVRSLIIAVLELGVEEIMVITHTNCGVASITPGTIRSHLAARLGLVPGEFFKISDFIGIYSIYITGYENKRQER